MEATPAASASSVIGLDEFKTKPRRHQHEDLARSWHLSAWGRFHEMRTGKGVLTVYEMDLLARAGLATRFLVVCPKRVMSTWVEMIRTHARTKFWVVEPTGLPNLPDVEPVVALYNYDRVWKVVNGRTTADPRLMAWEPEYVAADEAHKIKNRTSKRAKAMHVLGRIAKFRRALTGTPDPTSYADYWSIFKFLEPSVFGPWTYFAHEYLLLNWYKQVIGYRNVAALAEKIHSIGSRVTRVSAGLDVPAVEDQIIEVEMPPKAKRIYAEMAENLYAEIEADPLRTASAPVVLTKLMRLSQITGGFVMTHESDEAVPVHTAKIDALLDKIEEVTADAGAKVVVFFRFRAELAAVAARLGRAKVRHLELHGGTKDDAGVHAAFRDQSVRAPRVLLAQIAAGSLGIDLSSAETAIFYSWDYDAATYQQARDRIWKQGGKLTYIHLLVPNTIDGTMLKVAQKKIDRSTLLLDRWKEIIGGIH